MEGLNAPLVKNLAALLQEALAIASALQDNNDPLSRDVRESLYAQLDQIKKRIADGSREGRLRCVRGASWGNHRSGCRSAFRNHNQPDNASSGVGFRVICLAPTDHAIPLEDRHG